MLYLQNLRLKRSINKIRSMARSLGGKWGRCNINIFVPHTHTHTAAEKTNRWLYSSETLVLETAWPQERRIRRTAQLGLVQVILPQWPKDARRRREIWKPGEPRVCVCAIILLCTSYKCIRLIHKIASVLRHMPNLLFLPGGQRERSSERGLKLLLARERKNK